MSVSVVTCCYGPDYPQFVPGWLKAVWSLDPAPDEVIVASDRRLGLGANVMSLIGSCPRKHPQAFYLNLAISAARSEWVWIVDVDDRPFPFALAGLDEVAADVWVMGYQRSDGYVYALESVTAEMVLEAETSIVPAGSAIRREAFRSVGGFRDVAFQDWLLWRTLAGAGAAFESSARAHYHYVRHEQARSERELTPDRRAHHLVEMRGAEHAAV